MCDSASGGGYSHQTKRRKSIFRRIADSLSSLVPSVILPQKNSDSDIFVEDSPVIDAELSKCKQRDSNTQAHSVYPSSVNVDLDAIDNSDEELSGHSSTSGVSSLFPRKTSVQPNTAPSNSLNRKRMGSYAYESPRINTPTAPWSSSFFKKEDNPVSRPSKRMRRESDQSSFLRTDSDRSSQFYSSRTTYGGAASCRPERRDIFQSTVPLRFELEPATNASTETSSVAVPNLSSAARQILKSLERFSTNLSLPDRLPPNNYGNSPLSTQTIRTRRYPPYLHAYQQLKFIRQRTRANEAQLTRVEQDTIPPPKVTVSSVSSNDSPHTSRAQISVPPSTSHNPVSMIEQLPPLRSTAPADPPLSLTTTTSAVVDFTFASPIRRTPSVATQLALATSRIKPTPVYSFSSPMRLNLLPLSPVVVSCPATQIAPSSIFNLIVSSPETKSTVSSLPTVRPASLPTWRCETCLSENLEFREICSACSSPKPRSAQVAVSSNSKSTGVDTVVISTPIASKTTGRWQCSTCLVFNDSCKSTCVCCSASKPVSKPSTNTEGSTTVTPAQTSDKWVCSSCLVRNDPSKDNCPCCGTAKPGSRGNAFPKLGNITSAVNSTSNSCPFTFGAPASTATSSTTLPTLTFGSGNLSVTTSKPVGETTFTFGSTAVSNAGFTFSAPNSVIVSSTTSMPSSTPTPSVEKPPSFQFGLPIVTKLQPTVNGLSNGNGDLSSAPSSQSSKPFTFPGQSSTSGSMGNGPLKFTFTSLQPAAPSSFSFGSSTSTLTFPASDRPINPPSSQLFSFGQAAPTLSSADTASSNNLDQSLPSSGNVFSVASSSGPPRKKLHAVRRLHR